jgi:hypothetical protein
MTPEHLVKEVASKATQTEAFNTLLACMQVEIHDVHSGDSPPPAYKAKYDAIFAQVGGKANEILTAIQKDKPPLAPLAATPASNPGGPFTPNPSTVWQDKPGTVPPSAAVKPSGATTMTPDQIAAAKAAGHLPPQATPYTPAQIAAAQAAGAAQAPPRP